MYAENEGPTKGMVLAKNWPKSKLIETLKFQKYPETKCIFSYIHRHLT